MAFIHVKHHLVFPNPLCDIHSLHDYLHPQNTEPIPEGIPHLAIEWFQKHDNPFPTTNCWKVVAPTNFDPVGEPWVYLPEGYGKVWIQDRYENANGWRLFKALTDEDGLITQLAFHEQQ